MTQIHWANPVSGDFTNASDWTGGVVPGGSDTAVLDASGAAFTVKTSTTVDVTGLQLASNAILDIAVQTLQTGYIGDVLTNAGAIVVGDGATLDTGGTLFNAGAISLAGAGSGADLALITVNLFETITLEGGGTVTLSDSARNRIFNDNRGIQGFHVDTLDNVDNTISGAGVIGRLTAPFPQNDYLLLHNDAKGVIDATGANTLTLDQGTYAIVNAGLIEATGAGGLVLKSGIANSGEIAVGQGAGASSLIVVGGVELTGGGALVLSDNARNEIRGLAGVSTLANFDNTISGAGAIGGAGLSLFNEAAGVIDANDSVALVIATGSNTVGNNGLIEATGAGGLIIRSTGVNNQAASVILAGNGSHVALQGADIMGGTLMSVGSGRIETFRGAPDVLDGTANAIDNQATVVVQSGTALTLEGSLINQGRIDLASSGSLTTLTIGAAGVTLSGGGAVALTANANNVITGASSAATLTNVDNTISGAGLLGAGAMTLVNQAKGVINANGASALVIDTGANAIDNVGTIEATGAGGLTIAGVIYNTGVLKVAGGTLTVDGSVGGAGAGVIVGGTLYFKGAFNQNVFFKGATGVLEFDFSQAYGHVLTGFSKTGGTSLDLRDIAFVNSGEASYSGTATSGVLTVSDGTRTSTFFMHGDYLGSTFTASSDGHGGTIVVDHAAASSAHRFIAASAALGAGGAGSMGMAHEAWRAQPPMLSKPGVMAA